MVRGAYLQGPKKSVSSEALFLCADAALPRPLWLELFHRIRSVFNCGCCGVLVRLPASAYGGTEQGGREEEGSKFDELHDFWLGWFLSHECDSFLSIRIELPSTTVNTQRSRFYEGFKMR